MFKQVSGIVWRQWAPLPLRLVIGYGFIDHGWAKLSRGPAQFAQLLDQIGAPMPELTAWVSTLIEILGGLAILAGAFVAVVSVPLIVMMLVAMFTVHLRYGFSAINTIGLTADGPQFGPPGYEVNLLYIAGLLALILGGAGALSIDGLLTPRSEVPRIHLRDSPATGLAGRTAPPRGASPALTQSVGAHWPQSKNEEIP
jgi:putative oxidoreductase